jgi:hypothetical protein
MHFYMFDVRLFYISLPSWPDTNALYTVVDWERYSLFIVDHWVQTSGNLRPDGKLIPLSPSLYQFL